MTKDEALKLALDVLYENTNYSMRGDPVACQDERNDDTILLIKDVLSQPVQPAAVGAVEQDKLPLLTSAFRTTVSSGADKRYEMVFSFGDLTTLHAANREWLEFIRAAIAAKGAQ